MTKIEAIVRPNKFEAVKTALIDMGVEGMTVSEVRGHGRQKGHTEVFRGREYDVDLLPKIKVELVLSDESVEKAIDAISTAAYTGKIGDGKIFLYQVGGPFGFAVKNVTTLQFESSNSGASCGASLICVSLAGNSHNLRFGRDTPHVISISYSPLRDRPAGAVVQG